MLDITAVQLCAYKLSAYGVVIMTSASTSSWSNLLFSPSLSEVVTRVWPCSSIHFRIPSSFSVVPKSFGSSRACSWPYTLQSAFRFERRVLELGHTSYKTRRTLPCCEAVAVSVLTPPKLFASGKRGATLCESKELAGRARRRAERANTILNEWRGVCVER